MAPVQFAVAAGWAAAPQGAASAAPAATTARAADAARRSGAMRTGGMRDSRERVRVISTRQARFPYVRADPVKSGSGSAAAVRAA